MLSCRDAQAGSKKRWKTFPLVQQKEIQICYFLWVPWGQPGQGRTFLYVLKAMSSTSFSPNKAPAFSTTNLYFWGCYLHCQINPPPCSLIASALQMLLWSGKVLGGNQLFSFGSKSRYCSGDISPLELSPPGSLYSVPTGCLLISSELQTCSTHPFLDCFLSWLLWLVRFALALLPQACIYRLLFRDLLDGEVWAWNPRFLM